MKGFDANYHSHTVRCGHATGRDEDYVKEAMKAGFKVLGFSDHIMLPNINQPRIRGAYFLLDNYLSSVNELKQKYKGRIEIHLGFEAEWLGEGLAEYYRHLLTTKKIKYLILGQHCCYRNGNLHWYDEDVVSLKDAVDHYGEDLLTGMRSGLFTYVCHPDLFLRWLPGEWTEQAEELTYKIAKEAKERNLPLEINMGMMNFHPERNIGDPDCFCYPYIRFWEIVKEVGAPAIIGVDAHTPDTYRYAEYGKVLDFAKKLGIKPLKRVDFPHFE